MTAQLQHIAGQFTRQAITAISPLGRGLINDTYRIDAQHVSFVLQRLNHQVFPQPELIMANLQQLSQHIQKKPIAEVRLQIPQILYTHQQTSFFLDDEQQYWRAIQLIQPAVSRELLENPQQAAQIGYALAHFHHLCHDLDPTELYDTLPGFHITPQYYQHYLNLLQQPLTVICDDDFRNCLNFIQTFSPWLDSLEQGKSQGILQERTIHGDPKLNNFLFHPETDHVVSLIDLDTVKAGLIHYDIGDCIRSSCHDHSSNTLDLMRCKIILQHYLREAGNFFSAADYQYLYNAILLIPFELGLRYFSDYLNGNRYFKISHSRHNLQRAIALFVLCKDIQAQRSKIERIIETLQTA